MAVDAIELSFERDYITTFVIASGDSDFTPLVDKLRSLNKLVIGVGLQASTSALLPPACDEFLFYERLEGVDLPRRTRGRGKGRGRAGEAKVRGRAPEAAAPIDAGRDVAEQREEPPPDTEAEPPDLAKLLTQTLSGLQRQSGGAVLASTLKRAILRKDPTFNEADYGFRAFGELLRHLEQRRVIELSSGQAKGDPEVGFPETSSSEEKAFRLLRDVVADLERADGRPPLSGLKDQLRKRDPAFSEKAFGFGGFLQFCKAARTRGLIRMDWDEQADDYVLGVVHDA